MDSAGGNMTQTLVIVVLFVAAIATLPWWIRRMQQRQGGGPGAAASAASKVVSTVGIGPQQRVITVEVGPEHQRTWLVLGVTAQQIRCLHVIDPSVSAGAPRGAIPAPSFADEVAAARLRGQEAPHG